MGGTEVEVVNPVQQNGAFGPGGLGIRIGPVHGFFQLLSWIWNDRIFRIPVADNGFPADQVLRFCRRQVGAKYLVGSVILDDHWIVHRNAVRIEWNNDILTADRISVGGAADGCKGEED